jgi:hypothetical protein
MRYAWVRKYLDNEPPDFWLWCVRMPQGLRFCRGWVDLYTRVMVRWP